MAFHLKSQSGEHRHGVFWSLAISMAGHLMLLGFIIYSPSLKSESPYRPGVIDVQFVELSPAPGKKMAATAPDRKDPVPAPVAEKKIPQEIPSISPKQPAESQPEVSVAPQAPKTKTALKYKTIKSKEVLKSALQRLEQKVESEPARQLQDTIKRLKEQVAKEGRPESESEVETEEGAAEQTGSGLFGHGSEQESELIDLYRHEVAFAINKNWAYSQQLAGGGADLVAQLAFKVMPDGKITDVFFTDRSGNAFLDDSAYKAIMKSSPVKSHPAGLKRAYVEMGLRFTPRGVQ